MPRLLRTLKCRGRFLRVRSVFLVALLPVVLLVQFNEQSAAHTRPAPVRGLEGRYYESGAYEIDALGLPIVTGPPSAVRVDPQIAFGRGEGFDNSQGQREWYAHPRTDLVIWTGYIHFPAAGTYYLTTASQNGAAVYLNEARVALSTVNGYIPSEAFAYHEPGIQGAWDPARHTYLVPIEVEGPLVYPIEVRYVASNMGGVGFGIDLYWTRPGGPKDPSGKPVAEIVPSEVLYVEPPSEVARAQVSGPHTTIASDFLYYPAGADSFATLTVRVADDEGRPISGRRVHVSAMTDRGPRDFVEQPSEPTDAEGIVTVRVRPPGGQQAFNTHTGRYFATVLGDYVDAGQTAEMRYSHGEGVLFLPYAFAPYYDGNSFLIAPQPLQVGQEATITVPLTNRQAEPYELYISVTSKETNIGLWDWNALGRSESVVLRPGETKELSIQWTPTETLDHVCFKVTVWGKAAASETASATGSGFGRLAAWLLMPNDVLAQETGEAKPMESRTQNAGSVGSEPTAVLPPGIRERMSDRLDQIMEVINTPELPNERKSEYYDRLADISKKRAEDAFKGAEILDDLGLNAGDRLEDYFKWQRAEDFWRNIADTWKEHEKRGVTLDELLRDWESSQSEEGSLLLRDEEERGPLSIRARFSALLASSVTAARAAPPVTPQVENDSTVGQWVLLRRIAEIDSLLALYLEGEISGTRLEQKARLEVIHAHAAAASAEVRKMAAVLESEVEALPPDTPRETARRQEALDRVMERLRTEGLTEEDLARYRAVGIPDSMVQSTVAGILASDEASVVLTEREYLLQTAAAYRTLAEEFEKLEGLYLPEPQLRPHPPMMATYALANPHDRAETIDLEIRPASLPPAWKLFIAAAEALPDGTVPEVYEDEAGRRYRVDLPPNTSVQMTTVLVPFGELGEGTTARWSVEGRIGEELLGGIVQEMHVPGGAAVESAAPLPTAEMALPAGQNESGGWDWWWAAAAAGGLLLLVVLWMMMRRRRTAAM